MAADYNSAVKNLLKLTILFIFFLSFAVLMKEILKKLQQSVGKNVTQFARELGVYHQTLDNYLKGRILKADFLYKLANGKNINNNWLLAGESARPARKYPPKMARMSAQGIPAIKITTKLLILSMVVVASWVKTIS